MIHFIPVHRKKVGKGETREEKTREICAISNRECRKFFVNIFRAAPLLVNRMQQPVKNLCKTFFFSPACLFEFEKKKLSQTSQQRTQL